MDVQKCLSQYDVRDLLQEDAVMIHDFLKHNIGHEICVLNDGSNIMLEDGKTTLYAEAYMILDGKQWQICKEGESLSL